MLWVLIFGYNKTCGLKVDIICFILFLKYAYKYIIICYKY